MRKILMIVVASTLALTTVPVAARAGLRCDESQKFPSASQVLLRMIATRSVQMACSDAGASCSKDVDCCPGNFCAGGNNGVRVCIKI